MATGNKSVISELDIRIWLRDTDPAANVLLDDVEFSPEEIRTAMTLAVDYWNDYPPYIGATNVESFPWRSQLLRGTVANLLFISANRRRRNGLAYDVPGGKIDDQFYEAYDAAGQKMWDEYKQWVATNKRSMNISLGWQLVK